MTTKSDLQNKGRVKMMAKKSPNNRARERKKETKQRKRKKQRKKNQSQRRPNHTERQDKHTVTCR